MTEQEFDAKVKSIMDLYGYTEQTAMNMILKVIAATEDKLEFANTLKRVIDQQGITDADLKHGRELIDKDYRTGGIKRGELNYLFAETDSKRSLFFKTIKSLAEKCGENNHSMSEEKAIDLINQLKPFIANKDISFSETPEIVLETNFGSTSEIRISFRKEEEGSISTSVTRIDVASVGKMKLFIFDYFHHCKPGIVFAHDKEEAIKLIREAGMISLPDKFYSSVKEIEIPSDSGYLRYNTEV